MDMKTLRKTYSNGQVTVVWQPGKCIHTGICFHGLPGVFDPRKRPWVNAEGADTASIVEQVRQCPSGALSFYMNKGHEAPSEHPSGLRVEVMKDGPLIVYGPLQLKTDGNEQLLENRTTAFCRCGLSGNKPFCDGSHVQGNKTERAL
jgi:uncharacterized Fe-S cluster protein YjdI